MVQNVKRIAGTLFAKVNAKVKFVKNAAKLDMIRMPEKAKSYEYGDVLYAAHASLKVALDAAQGACVARDGTLLRSMYQYRNFLNASERDEKEVLQKIRTAHDRKPQCEKLLLYSDECEEAANHRVAFHDSDANETDTAIMTCIQKRLRAIHPTAQTHATSKKAKSDLNEALAKLEQRAKNVGIVLPDIRRASLQNLTEIVRSVSEAEHEKLVSHYEYKDTNKCKKKLDALKARKVVDRNDVILVCEDAKLKNKLGLIATVCTRDEYDRLTRLSTETNQFSKPDAAAHTTQAYKALCAALKAHAIEDVAHVASEADFTAASAKDIEALALQITKKVKEPQVMRLQTAITTYNHHQAHVSEMARIMQLIRQCEWVHKVDELSAEIDRTIIGAREADVALVRAKLEAAKPALDESELRELQNMADAQMAAAQGGRDVNINEIETALHRKLFESAEKFMRPSCGNAVASIIRHGLQRELTYESIVNIAQSMLQSARDAAMAQMQKFESESGENLSGYIEKLGHCKTCYDVIKVEKSVATLYPPVEELWDASKTYSPVYTESKPAQTTI